MAEYKAVLVEDENSPLSFLKDALQKSGFQVAVCHSGFEAIDEVTTEGGDVIIASSQMSDIGGFQLSCLLKTSRNTPKIPVVLLVPKEQLGDHFWNRMSMADLLIDRKESEIKTVPKIKQLVEATLEKGRKVGATESLFFPSDRQTQKLLSSHHELLSILLLERSMQTLARQLLESLDNRVEFMSYFFNFMAGAFGAEVTGLMVADPRSPWGIFEVVGSVTRSSFDKITAASAKAVGLQSEPRLIINGDFTDKGGASIKASEILTVSSNDGGMMGAVSIGWTTKTVLDEESKAATELLRVNLQPVFLALFDKQEIQILRQREAYWSSTDPVTGVYNAEFLLGFLQQQLLFSFRQKLPVGVILVDVDRFLELNQEFGTQIGDIVLTTIAGKLTGNIRSSDLIARYGGDQFAVVLPNTDLAGSKILGEKLRADIEKLKWEKIQGKTPKVTISVGCAVFNMEDVNAETILRDAKMALMKAKEKGRNQVSV